MVAGEFSPNTGEGMIAGCPGFSFDFPESKKRFECLEVLFCPA